MVRLFINTARRLALKIASYGVMHLVVAVLVAFAITRDWRVALAVGLVELSRLLLLLVVLVVAVQVALDLPTEQMEQLTLAQVAVLLVQVLVLYSQH